jgi:hypothetical protein
VSPTRTAIYGLMAELSGAEALREAAARARESGFSGVEAYAPFPVEGLAEAVGFAGSRVSLWTLVGGILGGTLGYFLQWYSAVIDYPLDIGGRPLHSWPAFIPIAFELTVLGAALFAFFAMLAGNGLPRLRHPIFDAPGFDCATRDRFFLCLRADDESFAPESARRFLESLDPARIVEVPL